MCIENANLFESIYLLIDMVYIEYMCGMVS